MASKHRAGVEAGPVTPIVGAKLELTNEAIRQAVGAIDLLLVERLPRECGVAFQMAKQPLRYALDPINAEHDRLVMMAVVLDKRKQPVREGNGFRVRADKIDWLEKETAALWKQTQAIRLKKISRTLIPEKVEGKPLVVPGVVWEFLEPILTD